MDVQVIGQLVASLGFPIVAAAALFWYINQQRKSHEEESKGMQKSLEENTKILAELKELISIMFNKLDGN